MNMLVKNNLRLLNSRDNSVLSSIEVIICVFILPQWRDNSILVLIMCGKFCHLL